MADRAPVVRLSVGIYREGDHAEVHTNVSTGSAPEVRFLRMPKAKEQAVGNLATDMVVELNDRAAGQNGQRARAGARQLEAMASTNTPISAIATHAPA